MKKQPNILLLLIMFIAGFIAGTGFTIWKTGKLHDNGQAEKVADGSPIEQIAALKRQLAANPQDGAGWVRLGNLYYDSNQPQKAIDAYVESIQLMPATAGLLTDLGVMYRRANQPEKAISYFDKAIAKQADHLPSRFNKGVVLLNDLADPRAAIAVWEEIIAIDPDAATGSGQRIADIIDGVKKDLPPEAKTDEQPPAQ